MRYKCASVSVLSKKDEVHRMIYSIICLYIFIGERGRKVLPIRSAFLGLYWPSYLVLLTLIVRRILACILIIAFLQTGNGCPCKGQTFCNWDTQCQMCKMWKLWSSKWWSWMSIKRCYHAKWRESIEKRWPFNSYLSSDRLKWGNP